MAAREQTIVLGAGLTGLAAAYRLRSGYSVLERSNRPGGLSTTEEDRGYRFDKTGHLLHIADKKIRRTVLALFDEEPLEIERKSRIYSHGVYTHYPFQANTHGLPKEVVEECLVGFINASSNAKAATKNDTFYDFILRHMGEGIAKHFMVPYNQKLWGVHPSEITALWCKRFVPVPEVEEVVSGALGSPQTQIGYNAKFLYPKSGIGELPNAFARRVKNIRFGQSIKAIDLKKRRLFCNGEWHSYETLISTIPLDRMLEFVQDPPKHIAGDKKKLRCAPLWYLDIALNCKAQKDYHWIYVPEKKYPFYRVGCYSNFSKQMAPRGKSNLYVELASRSRPEMRRLMPRVARGLVDMGLIQNEGQIVFALPKRIGHAYVIYDAPRETAVPRIHRWLEGHGVISAGRYGSWEYSAMEDAIKQGFEAARKVKDLLK